MEKIGTIRIASLFSGCGGMDLGVLGGFNYLESEYPRNPTEIVYAVDNDNYATEIYNSNFEHKCQTKDVRQVEPKEIPSHEILIGGFPCQSFSIVALNPPRLGYKHENGRLFFEMCRILENKKPSCFIAENVKGILSANKGKAFPLILKEFEKAGYHVRYRLLDSSDYGIPQKRERVFIVGFKDVESFLAFDFPKPITSKNKVPLMKVLLPEDKVPQKYFFSEKAIIGMKKVKEKMNKGRVQNPGKPSNTIGAHLCKVSLNSTDPVLKENGKYRRFTPREAARIQSFPESFILIGADGRQYRAIGNAVPPVLMWYVTRRVIDTLRGTKCQSLTNRPFGEIKEKSHSRESVVPLNENLESETVAPILIEKYNYPKVGDKLEIELTASSEITFAYLRFPKKNRNFFPGYKIAFALETDRGTITTQVTSAKGKAKQGDFEAGAIIQGGLTPWYSSHPEITLGRKIVFECVEPFKKYKLCLDQII